MSKFDISFDQKIKKGWTRGTMTKFGELLQDIPRLLHTSMC